MRKVDEIESPGKYDINNYDEYNWRQIGKKRVKGNENEKHYNKCSTKDCLAKRTVQRIGTKIIMTYEGEHTCQLPVRYIDL
jgi:hypothetical protein